MKCIENISDSFFTFKFSFLKLHLIATWLGILREKVNPYIMTIISSVHISTYLQQLILEKFHLILIKPSWFTLCRQSLLVFLSALWSSTPAI